MSNLSSKKEQIKKLFSHLTREEMYTKLLDLSTETDALHSDFSHESQKVIGCQSQMYVYVEEKDSKLYFTIYSDALISRGIGALFCRIYNGLTAEEILKADISFLKELGIITSLSANRLNGLSALNLKMKSLALTFIKTKI